MLDQKTLAKETGAVFVPVGACDSRYGRWNLLQ